MFLLRSSQIAAPRQVYFTPDYCNAQGLVRLPPHLNKSLGAPELPGVGGDSGDSGDSGDILLLIVNLCSAKLVWLYLTTFLLRAETCCSPLAMLYGFTGSISSQSSTSTSYGGEESSRL